MTPADSMAIIVILVFGCVMLFAICAVLQCINAHLERIADTVESTVAPVGMAERVFQVNFTDSKTKL